MSIVLKIFHQTRVNSPLICKMRDGKNKAGLVMKIYAFFAASIFSLMRFTFWKFSNNHHQLGL